MGTAWRNELRRLDKLEEYIPPAVVLLPERGLMELPVLAERERGLCNANDDDDVESDKGPEGLITSLCNDRVLGLINVVELLPK